ncbi:MAG TPA: dihydrolipoamide acetyltransferase family protein [Myxococcota bacterium]|nr:dihydrolipoamide acetyltransferase family protein [Myxococcota bacterium]
MAENIVMPQLGESIAEGTIVKWLKEPGDVVKKDENILLISTDKVEAEIPSPGAGVLLEILVGPGETVAVGTVLARVGAQGEAVAPMGGKLAEPKAKDEKKKGLETPIVEKALPQQVRLLEEEPEETREGQEDMSSFLSPLVRKIAFEHKVSEQEMKNISGTGRGGRVSKKDLLDYLEGRKAPQAKSLAISPLQREIQSSSREVEKPISTMRRVIIENMVASRRTSAHVTTFFEIDYTAIDKIRAIHKEQFFKDEQVSLTYTTFLAAAVCQVLKRHPYINATLGKEAIIFKKDIHLGIAVAIENPEPGLMVPVIKNADKQNLRGLAHAINEMSSRVRARKIKPDELSGGTFTITNPGNYGAIIGTPIINQPQVAILGVGRIKKQATVLEVDGTDVIAIRRMGWLSLSFDHRLVDGATADIFMADLKQTLENWTSAP